MDSVLIPEDILKSLGEVKLLGTTLVTDDGSVTTAGVCLHWGVVSCLVFSLLYKASRFYTPLHFSGYRKMSLHDQRDWDTRLGNILYSAFIVTVAVRELMGSDYFWRTEGPGSDAPPFFRTNPTSTAALAVSAGFFAFELVVTLKYWMGGTPMVFHHVGALACCFTALATAQGHCATLWMLSTEFTTPFIAFRYLLDKGGMKTHFLYILNGLAILSSWTVARLATFPPFFLLVWRQRGSIKDMHPASAFLLLVFPVTLFALNAFWYSKIIQGALKLFLPTKPGEARLVTGFSGTLAPGVGGAGSGAAGAAGAAGAGAGPSGAAGARAGAGAGAGAGGSPRHAGAAGGLTSPGRTTKQD